MTIIQLKVISGHQVKNVKQKTRNLEQRYMSLGQIFAKNAKNDPGKLFEASKSIKKNKIRKITVKSQNDVKSVFFLHVLCHNSAILEDIDLTFCIHIYQQLPFNIYSVFL